METIFKPSFAKLTSATIWVQFHNLPVEFWEDDTLETLSASWAPFSESMSSCPPLLDPNMLEFV